MNNFFKYRSKLTFASLVLGLTILVNLTQLLIKINGSFTFVPYLLFMAIACLSGVYGFLKIDEKALGISTVSWIVSIVFNVGAAIFVVPIILMNIIGRNKMIAKQEKEEEKNI